MSIHIHYNTSNIVDINVQGIRKAVMEEFPSVGVVITTAYGGRAGYAWYLDDNRKEQELNKFLEQIEPTYIERD